MVSVFAKSQLCGKHNCKCYQLGQLHGPYWYVIIYIRKEDRKKFNLPKQVWVYKGITKPVGVEYDINRLEGSRVFIDQDSFNLGGLRDELTDKYNEKRVEITGKKTLLPEEIKKKVEALEKVDKLLTALGLLDLAIQVTTGDKVKGKT